MRPRVLTVGDGDLSYSLAIARCCGEAIELTATVLPSEPELCATYARAAVNLRELRQRGARVLAKVDATLLPVETLGQHDAIVFNHPHLGLSVDQDDEASHARHHEILLSHFLYTAASALTPGGSIYVTLSGNQPHTWRLHAAAARVGLTHVDELNPTSPPLPTVFDLARADTLDGGHERPLRPATPQPGWAARRKYRNGALGSRHWLGKYGYEHRRCESDGEMDVSRSVVHVLRKQSAAGPHDGDEAPLAMGSPKSDMATKSSSVQNPYCCGICEEHFCSEEALRAHQLHPAPLPMGSSPLPPSSQLNSDLQAPADLDTDTFGEPDVAVSESEPTPEAAAEPEPKSPGTTQPWAESTVRSSKLHERKTTEHQTLQQRFVVIVSEDSAGARLRTWARGCDEFGSSVRSKSQCARALSEQRLLVNGQPAEPSRLLHEGDRVELIVCGRRDHTHQDTQHEAAAHKLAASNPDDDRGVTRESGRCEPRVVSRCRSDIAVIWKPRGTSCTE